MSECIKRPQSRNEQYQRRQNQPHAAFQAQSNLDHAEGPPSPTIMLTPDQIREMIQSTVASAFSSTGVNGRYNTAFSTFISPSSWSLILGLLII